MGKRFVAAYVGIVLAAFLVMSFSFSDVKGVSIGDGQVQYYVNGVFTFNEAIVLQGNATLVVENATLEFIQTKDYQYGIKLQGLDDRFPSLKVKNATLKSSKGVLISVDGSSSVVVEGLKFDGAGKSKGQIKLYGESYLRAVSSSIPYVYCYDSSRSELVASNPNYLYVYENATGVVDGCTIFSIKVYDNGLVNVSLSTVKSGIYAEDLAKVFVGTSSVTGEVFSRNNSTVSIFNSNVHQMKALTYNYGSVLFKNVTYSPHKYPEEVRAKDFSTAKLVGCKLSSFIFKVEGNATLSVEDSSITSSTFYFYGDSVINFSRSYLDWLVEAHDQSSINAVDSTFNILSLTGDSSLNASGCKVGWVRCYDFSKILAEDSKFREVLVELSSINVTLHSFQEGYFDQYNFVAGGLNATFLRSSVDSGWSFRFSGFSNVSLYDSRLVNLYAGDQSILYLFNTSYVNLNVGGSAVVYVWSYLVVRVVDYFGSPVGGVNVTVLLPSPVTKFTGDDGRAVFLLSERFVNASGDFPASRYDFVVVFGGSSKDYSVELAGSRVYTCSVASPWWYWYVVYGIVAIIVVLFGFGAFVFLRRRRVLKASRG